MNAQQIRELASRIAEADTDEQAVAMATAVVDHGVRDAIAKGEAGTGSTDTPRSTYPGILMRLAQVRESLFGSDRPRVAQTYPRPAYGGAVSTAQHDASLEPPYAYFP